MRSRLTLSFFLILALAIPLSVSAQEYELDFTAGDGVPRGVGGAVACDFEDNPVSNCSFEADVPVDIGDTRGATDWVIQEATMPFLVTDVYAAGTSGGFGFFATAPTDGGQSLLLAFDAEGPTAAQAGQDISIPSGNSATLSFDYRGAWDTTFGATLDRTFSVNIEPTGGGAPMQSDLLLTALPGETIVDTGIQTASIDVSAFTGQSVRVNFVTDIPEPFTGPAQLEIDNVSVAVERGSIIEVPTLNQVGLGALAVTLATLALLLVRRRA